MGHVSAKQIRKAADFLRERLVQSDDPLKYSCLYDGTEATHAWLTDLLELDGSESPSAELLIDLAAQQLERLGWITNTQLDTFLADGEPNYQMALTPRGRSCAPPLDAITDVYL